MQYSMFKNVLVNDRNKLLNFKNKKLLWQNYGWLMSFQTISIVEVFKTAAVHGAEASQRILQNVSTVFRGCRKVSSKKHKCILCAVKQDCIETCG